MNYKQKCCALKLLPLDKQLLLDKCVLMRKVVHDKAREYLKNLMIPSERLHAHGNKQLLPRTRTDIFKISFSFSGFLAWNSLPHHLRYPMDLKTLKRKAFQALTKPPWWFFVPFARHLDTKCMEVFPPCVFLSSFTFVFHTNTKSTFNICIFVRYCTLFHFPCGHRFNGICVCVCECVCVCLCACVRACMRCARAHFAHSYVWSRDHLCAYILPCYVWNCLYNYLYIFVCFVCLFRYHWFVYSYLCTVCFSLSCKAV